MDEQQAKALHSIAYYTRPWRVYRKLSNGDYKYIGQVWWHLNYNAMPFKQKYWTLIYLSMFNEKNVIEVGQ